MELVSEVTDIVELVGISLTDVGVLEDRVDEGDVTVALSVLEVGVVVTEMSVVV